MDAFGNADSTVNTTTRLAALMEAMSEHPTVTYEEGNRSVTVDSGRAIFLLVSDVGAEGINAAVLRYSRRSDVAPVSGVLFFSVFLLPPAALRSAFSQLARRCSWEEENIVKHQETREMRAHQCIWELLKTELALKIN